MSHVKSLTFTLLVSFLLLAACEKNPLSWVPPLQSCPSCPPGPYTLVDFPYDVSPNESLLVYGHIATPDLPAGVYLIGLAPGSAPKYLMPYVSPDYADPWGLRFSPDGKRLAYARGGYYDLGVFDLEAMQERRVTFTNGNAQAGDWDPSGRYIVYPRPDLDYDAPDTSAGVFIVDTETLSDRPLLHDSLATYGGDPRWSPDSASVAFWYGTKFGGSYGIHLYTVKVDGSGYRDLMPSSTKFSDSQRWIGNNQLIYEFYPSSSMNIHETRMMDLTTGESRRWSSDLRLFVNPITRNGSHYVYPYPDATGRGVIFIQETADPTGRTRRQVTGLVSQ